MITDEMFKKGKFWNKGPMVVTGCTKVSPGCKNCWSEQAHVMRSGNKAMQHLYRPDSLTHERFNGKVQFNLDRLKDAVKGKKPQVIAIWNDLYHEGVSIFQIGKVHRLMDRNPQHTYLIITKRIDRAADYCESVSEFAGVPVPDNIIHIATMENQDMVDKRMPDLLRIPGKRGIIIEPMLGPVDLCPGCLGSMPEDKMRGDDFDKGHYMPRHGGYSERCKFSMIDQVILGPENGAGKRPFKEEWAESVQAQCEAADVPFYRKDLGEGELIWR